MSHAFATTVDGSKKVRLADFDPDDTGGLTKEQGAKRLDDLGVQLAELTNLLAYAGDQGLLIVLQGRDASGKDGTVRKILEYGNVLSARICPFKAPTAEELGHDFLWRVHKQVPAKGSIALFNRSHYEDVIAVRVHELCPPEVWQPRFEQINQFERLLVGSGTIVLKFFLNVSKGEQRKRLEEREEDPLTAWKLNVNDWKEIPLWAETSAAYEDVLRRCSSPELPWHVVPADHKWFRNLAVVERIVHTLAPYRDAWLTKLKRVRKSALAEIEPIREQLGKGDDKHGGKHEGKHGDKRGGKKPR
jgi:PPK2 family polyphosphate:nucleotide phosphotransferase